MTLQQVFSVLTLDSQRGHLFGWVPVFLAIGIGSYFMLPEEPDQQALNWGGFTLFCLALCIWRLPAAYRPLLVAVALVAAGVLLAAFRANVVAAPTLDWRYYGAVEGRVVGIDRSQSDKPRITLDQVVLDRIPRAKTPKHVRLSLHMPEEIQYLKPGMTVMTTGHLSPPPAPAEPGGFDFQRHAWFLQLGAVGYTRVPVVKLHDEAQSAWSIAVFRLRMTLSEAIQTKVSGVNGAVAAALITGDRSGIPQDVLRDLRASNLAHLLAISGLHMGLLAGFVFSSLRYILALAPGFAMRHPIRKYAAVGALIAASIYLILSGGTVATQRAYIMVAVMLMAILMGRRALTLRSVALAAILVLVLRPEALMGPGFQMSFAATTALVVVFSALRGNTFGLPRWTQGALGVLISSAVAGFATAPIAAAHFNQIPHYGLLANLTTVPLMGAVIMPAAVIAALLWPLGLAGVALWIMAKGIGWVVYVADKIAGFETALSHVVSPHAIVLPMMALGAVFFVLWRGPRKWLGVAGVAVALLIWPTTQRPHVLISESGGLIGVMGPDGRVLNKPRGDGFAASNWLENDGDGGITQAQTVERQGLLRRKTLSTVSAGDWQVLHVTGKAGKLPQDLCAGADWVITNQVQETPTPAPCLILDPKKLSKTGALAIYTTNSGPKVVSVRQASGQRLWNTGSDRKKEPAPEGTLTLPYPDRGPQLARNQTQ
ncbi:ComEC/Rec2 family competence protein [Algirhabdus cladophorae]|uniref:ComEC/Rec2 family competence protein n=1 Tax=Algirhabdus cladophorae TaxID=3377108 RepID=UPI003B845DB2